MIWSAQPGDKAVTVAKVYGEDGSVATIDGFNTETHLAVLIGGTPASVLSAEDSQHPALVVRVVRAEGEETETCRAADAVIAVPSEQLRSVAVRLARAIVTLGEPGHPWCCDWNDMLTIVKCSGAAVGRYGFGSAEGEEAAIRATREAREQIGRIAGERVLSLVTASTLLKGHELKAVHAEICRDLGHGNHLPGIRIQPNLQDGAVQVDIFLFGPAKGQDFSEDPPRRSPTDICIEDIPAFLRKGYQP